MPVPPSSPSGRVTAEMPGPLRAAGATQRVTAERGIGPHYLPPSVAQFAGQDISDVWIGSRNIHPFALIWTAASTAAGQRAAIKSLARYELSRGGAREYLNALFTHVDGMRQAPDPSSLLLQSIALTDQLFPDRDQGRQAVGQWYLEATKMIRSAASLEASTQDFAQFAQTKLRTLSNRSTMIAHATAFAEAYFEQVRDPFFGPDAMDDAQTAVKNYQYSLRKDIERRGSSSVCFEPHESWLWLGSAAATVAGHTSYACTLDINPECIRKLAFLLLDRAMQDDLLLNVVLVSPALSAREILQRWDRAESLQIMGNRDDTTRIDDLLTEVYHNNPEMFMPRSFVPYFTALPADQEVQFGVYRMIYPRHKLILALGDALQSTLMTTLPSDDNFAAQLTEQAREHVENINS